MCEIRLRALLLVLARYGASSGKYARVSAWVSGKSGAYLRLY